MIFNFGSISDLYNRIKLLNTRVANTEALDVAQNNRMTSIESVNTTQNTRLTNIESKLITSTMSLSRYITLNSGYTLNNGSYIRMYGNVVDMYLIVSGSFRTTGNNIGRINEIKPYNSGGNRKFYFAIDNTINTLTVDTSTGEMSLNIPAGYSVSTVTLTLTYII